MTTYREARDAALATARDHFFTVLCGEAERLSRALQAAQVQLDPDGDTSTLLHVTRTVQRSSPWVGVPLHNFEEAVRLALREYAAVSPRFENPAGKSEPILWPDAQAVLHHLRDHTDTSGDPNWLQRVVICAQHTFRAWRRLRHEQSPHRQ